ncbi:ATP-dependent DNA helicase [Trichonephila clavipes]|nr:ATP-dependent DNA helicase [Trichonephila clavipes]
MFAKIESERLRYIQCNQKKLRVEEYIHLRDAVVSEGNVSDVGQLIILPPSFTGSPRKITTSPISLMFVLNSMENTRLSLSYDPNELSPLGKVLA